MNGAVQSSFFSGTGDDAFADPKSPGGKTLSNEGHGLSRAVKDLRLTALAAEVGFSRPIGQSHVFSPLSSPSKIGKTYLRG